MPESLQSRVMNVVADVFGLDRSQVSLKTTKDEVETWDSLNIMHLVIAIESEFAVVLEPEEAGEFLSVEIICAILEEKLAE